MPTSERFSRTGDIFLERTTNKSSLANMHYHNSHELYFVINGERDYFIGNQFFKAYTADIVIVPKGIPHRTAGKGATRLLIHFTDDFLLRYFSKKVINDLISDLSPAVLTPTSDELESLNTLFKKMTAEYDKLKRKRRNLAANMRI